MVTAWKTSPGRFFERGKRDFLKGEGGNCLGLFLCREGDFKGVCFGGGVFECVVTAWKTSPEGCWCEFFGVGVGSGGV